MFTLRPAQERGRGYFGWLDSRHTFSFGNYYDPRHRGFSDLLVINDDTVVGGAGFPRHPHRDMEIVSYVLDGALEHRDSMGHGSVIRPGDVQRMSAGTGVAHSEFNHSDEDTVRFLQLWIQPEARGLEPGYEQKHFSPEARRGQLRVIASRDGAEDSVVIHQDARILTGLFGPGERAELTLAEGRRAWLHLARGRLRVGEHTLSEGDGLAISDVDRIELEGLDGSEDLAEPLIFDLR